MTCSHAPGATSRRHCCASCLCRVARFCLPAASCCSAVATACFAAALLVLVLASLSLTYKCSACVARCGIASFNAAWPEACCCIACMALLSQPAAHLLQLVLCLAERIPQAADLHLALQQLLLALLLRLLQVVLHAYGALHLP